MALLILSDMAEREAELGYTTPSRPIATAKFTLPSLTDIGVFGDSGPLVGSYNDFSESTRAKQPPGSPGKKSQSNMDGEEEQVSHHKGGPSSRSSTSSPSPLSQSEPSGTPKTTFSTWLPDDSLRFINPRFLSSDEKETLQSQLGKRKLGRRGDIQDKDLTRRGRKGAWQADGESVEQPRQTPPAEPKVSQPVASHIAPSAVPSRHLSQAPSPGHIASSSVSAEPVTSRPLLGPRSRTTDLDLLRQVKSNNLTLPGNSLYPPPYQHQFELRSHSKAQLNPLCATPPSYHPLPPRHPPHAYPLPFTHTPLVHPQPPADHVSDKGMGRQYQPLPNQRSVARLTTRAYTFHPPHSRVVHPPPAPARWEDSRQTPFPSVLQPVSPPRHVYPHTHPYQAHHPEHPGSRSRHTGWSSTSEEERQVDVRFSSVADLELG